MKYFLLLFVFAVGCASQPPADPMEEIQNDVPPPTIMESTTALETPSKKLHKKKAKAKKAKASKRHK